MNRNTASMLSGWGLAALAFLPCQPAAALDAPPLQRLVVPATAGESYNTGDAVALGERYALLGSSGSEVRVPGSSQTRFNAGEVFVFNAQSGAYVKRLISPGLSNNEAFGYAVAVSGNTAYISATGNEEGGNDSGIVYAIDIPSGKLLWKRSGLQDQQMGEAMAVDADNLVVGCYGALAGAVAQSGCLVHLNRLNGALLATYAPPVPESHSGFGNAVAVCGNLAVCGAPFMTVSGKSSQGQVTVIDLTTQTATHFSSPDGVAQDHFGHSVALAHGRLLIGSKGADAPGKPEQGAAYLYHTNPLQLAGKISAPTSLADNAQFGSAVALNGRMALITAWYDNASDGSAWLLDLQTLQLSLCGQRPQEESSEFGTHVAMNQTTALISDPDFFPGGNGQPNGASWLLKPLRQPLASNLHVVARSGDHAPGTLGARFNRFGEAALSPSGKVVHTATLSGPGVTNSNRQGLWDTLTESLDLVLRSGDQSSGIVYGASLLPFFHQQGNALFGNRLRNGRRAFLGDNGAYATPLLREGTSFPIYRVGVMNSSQELLRSLREVNTCFSSNSEAVVNYLSASTPGYPVSPAADTHIANKLMALADEVCEGLDSPIAGVSYGQLLPRVGVQGDKMVYASALAGSPATNQAVFIKTKQTNDAALIARKNDTAPGAGSALFSNFIGEGIVGGKVLLRAQLKGGDPMQREGLWSNRDGSLKAVVLAGQQAPGRPTGVTFRRFLKWFMTANFEVAFVATVGGSGVSAANDTGVWFNTAAGNTFSLLQEGATAPGCWGALTGPVQSFEVDANGNYVLLTALRGTASASNQALFFGNFTMGGLAHRQPVLSARKGSHYDRPGSELLAGLHLGVNNTDPQGCGSKGLARLLNANGAILSWRFADGSEELIRGKP